MSKLRQQVQQRLSAVLPAHRLGQAGWLLQDEGGPELWVFWAPTELPWSVRGAGLGAVIDALVGLAQCHLEGSHWVDGHYVCVHVTPFPGRDGLRESWNQTPQDVSTCALATCYV